eukprot:snap_masked-scaffold428_size174301-processed-gene-0.2 protein:Tk03102 transcript:snap_masked-scaffold428_size174301-processed-gene-0.2-mRNA-1 annotation:"conserved hypothetical protein"
MLRRRKNLVGFELNDEPTTRIIGGPDMFVDVGSMVNLSCVVVHTEKPPKKVIWLHNGQEISFRGPRNGVSVSYGEPSAPLGPGGEIEHSPTYSLTWLAWLLRVHMRQNGEDCKVGTIPKVFQTR